MRKGLLFIIVFLISILIPIVGSLAEEGNG